MATVITFSRNFPQGHPLAGQKTNFVEKYLRAVGIDYNDTPYFELLLKLNKKALADKKITQVQLFNFWKDLDRAEVNKKYHTIRQGFRWADGMQYSPRIWSGKPRRSPQITFAPDVTIKSTQDVVMELEEGGRFHIVADYIVNQSEGREIELVRVCMNDGLEPLDFKAWFTTSKDFKKDGNFFAGQIICGHDGFMY